MFDLPTNTKDERTEARKFREALLDYSFSMVQFSVYARHCLGKEKVLSLVEKIKKNVPKGGRIDILSITDKQFSNIIIFEGRNQKKNKDREQFLCF